MQVTGDSHFTIESHSNQQKRHLPTVRMLKLLSFENSTMQLLTT